MSVAEAFPLLPDHDRVLEHAVDDVMSLSNDLFKSSSFADLHAFAGSLFGDVSEPMPRAGCSGNDGLSSFGLHFVAPLVPVESAPQHSLGVIQFGTSVSAPPQPPAPQQVALGSSTHQPVSVPSPALPPPQQPTLSSGPQAAAIVPSLPSIPGYVTILDSHGNAILVDHASARALAGTTITVSPAPVPGHSLGPASLTTAVEKADGGGVQTSLGAATVSVGDACHGKVSSNCDESVQPSTGAPDQATRVKELAGELNALLSDDQKRQLNALHLQARQAPNPDEAAAASAAFWDLWYKFADAAKVNELKELMGRLTPHPQPVSGVAADATSPQHQQHTSPVVAPASQDSNNSSSGAHRNSRKRSPAPAQGAASDDEDLQDCAAGAPRAPKSPRLQLQAEAQPGAPAQPLAPEQQLQQPSGLDSVVRALQAYGAEQAGRLTSLEAMVKALERMHAAEAAARASAEQEAARLAGEVDRLRALLRANA